MGNLLYIIEFLSTIEVHLRSPELVDMAQQRYTLLLYRYLRSVYGPAAGAKLGSGLMIMELAREAYDIHKRMLPEAEEEQVGGLAQIEVVED